MSGALVDDATPADLRELKQWVVFRFELRNGKLTKVPYRADGTGHASATDRSSWSSYEKARAAVQMLGMDGICFAFSAGDPFTGGDLDDCRGEDGLLRPVAAAVVLRLDSYTEVSPSGRGVKVFMKANLGGFSRHVISETGWGGKFEVYDQKRFFTVTGDLLPGCPATIEPRQQQLEEILRLIFGEVVVPPTVPPRPVDPVDLPDRLLLERMFAARNGDEIRALYEGRWQGRFDSQSEADQALCNHLAFWTGRDPVRMAELFRTSGLWRPKWDERRGSTGGSG